MIVSESAKNESVNADNGETTNDDNDGLLEELSQMQATANPEISVHKCFVGKTASVDFPAICILKIDLDLSLVPIGHGNFHRCR